MEYFMQKKRVFTRSSE